MEVAECELEGEGLPVTQEGAEKFQRLMDKRMKKAHGRSNQMRGCYGPRRTN